MKTFWTDKEIENFLTQETRTVQLPEGRRRTVNCFHLTWRQLDGLLHYNIFSEEWYADHAEKIAQESRRFDFAQCFAWVIAYSFSDMKLLAYGGGIPSARAPLI